MKRVSAIPFAVLAAAFLALAGCGGGTGETGSQGAGSTLDGDTGGIRIVRVTSHIASPTTWSDSFSYVVDSEVRASSSLVILPGTIVKFERGGRLTTVGNGAIIAEGTASRRIRFTSIRDDAPGGDTNGDGNATVPSRGDWRGISLQGGNGSVFRSCDFTYSGDSYGGDGSPALDLGKTDRSVVDGCVFAENDGGDPGTPFGALKADSAGAATVVANNVFHANNLPLTIHPAVRVETGNLFHDPSDPSRTNRYNGVFVSGGDLTSPASWSGQEVPYVLGERLQVLGPLTIGPGAVVKFASGGSLETALGGTIRASGTVSSRVIFTSIRDDAHGGDTNGDGSAAPPSPGEWDPILLDGANGSVFRNCDFRYGGGGGHGALNLGTTSGTTVDGCIFADNEGGDPGNPWGALDAMLAGGATIITNNAFFGNSVPLTISEKTDLDATNRFHDPANPGLGNRYNGIFVLPGADLTAPRAWSASEVPFVVQKTLGIYRSLSLGPGVVLKFQPGTGLKIANRAGGSLVTSTGNEFTSIRDDARSGDTNGDGSGTFPQAADWEGIRYEYIVGSASNYADWPNIHYDIY